MEIHFKINPIRTCLSDAGKAIKVSLNRRCVCVIDDQHLKDSIYTAKKILLIETGMTEEEALTAIPLSESYHTNG